MEFDWLIPVPSLLHIEKNSVESIMALNLEVFMKEVVMTLGFRSENALKYMKIGSDHHKLWRILEIT